VSGQPSGLNPAYGDYGVADEAVAVVHVEDEGDVLSTGAEEWPSPLQVDTCYRRKG